MPSNLALKWREVIFRNGFKVKRGVKGKKKEKKIAIATRSILSIVKKISQFVNFNSEGSFFFLFWRDISWKKAIWQYEFFRRMHQNRDAFLELFSTHFGVCSILHWVVLFFSVNIPTKVCSWLKQCSYIFCLKIFFALQLRLAWKTPE